MATDKTRVSNLSKAIFCASIVPEAELNISALLANQRPQDHIDFQRAVSGIKTETIMMSQLDQGREMGNPAQC